MAIYGLGSLTLVALVFLKLWLGRPTLRVINTTEGALQLMVDGKPAGELPRVSSETPGAGVTLRLWPGEHRLAAVGKGADGGELQVRLASDSLYLYAPGDTSQCFWVQRTAYGQAKLQGPREHALPRVQQVWALPPDVDHWFVPSPPPRGSQPYFSGGVRTTVRQTRCGFPPSR